MGRRRGKRLTFAGLVIAMIALLGLVASSSSARLGPPWELEVSKQKTGPYDSNYGEVNIDSGDTKNLYYRVESTIDADYHDLRFDDASSNPGQDGYRVSWFKGKTDITNKVRGNGFKFDLPAESTKRFRARVKATQDADLTCLAGRARTDLEGEAYGIFAINGAKCTL